MKPLTYFIVFVLVAFTSILSLPLLNWKIDISRALSEDFEWYYKDRDPNYRYLRVAYYLQHQGDFDNIIFGSSRTRIGFSEKTLGNRWHKMELPGGALSDHLWALKILLSKSVKLEQIILALDDHDFYNPEDNFNDYFLRPYPNSSADWIDFYRFYLFRPYGTLEQEILSGSKALIRSNRITERPAVYRTPENNQLTEGHKKVYYPGLASRQLAEKSFDKLQTFIDLCNKNNIKLTVLITPRFFVSLYGQNLNHLLEINERIASMIDFYDFRQAHPWSYDPGYWLESSHFSANYGDEVLKIAQGKKSQLESFAPNFSWHVTKDSIITHNQRVARETINMIPVGKMVFSELKVHPSFKTTAFH